MSNKRGNPNWGRPMLPASVLCTEFEIQAKHLHLTPGPIRRLGSLAQMVRKKTKINTTSPNGCSMSLEHLRKFNDLTGAA